MKLRDNTYKVQQSLEDILAIAMLEWNKQKSNSAEEAMNDSIWKMNLYQETYWSKYY